MKITDISSSSKPSEEPNDNESSQESHNKVERKRSLLERYNIPIEHLDFPYVNKCTDSREIEKILKILRSGEEGTFPDLERCTEARLEKVHPKSRMLRVEKPAARTGELEKTEREAICSGLQEWLEDLAEASSTDSTSKSEIFTNGKQEIADVLRDFPLPIRGSSVKLEVEMSSKQLPAQGKKEKDNRIKSWEYDKWDKYDVDAEITKLDIVDMQVEEWEKREKSKIIEEQKRIEKLMKSGDVDIGENKSSHKSSTERFGGSIKTIGSKMVQGETDSARPPSKNAFSRNGQINKACVSVERPSFIEELDDDDESGILVEASPVFKSARRATLVIEDLNLPMYQ